MSNAFLWIDKNTIMFSYLDLDLVRETDRKTLKCFTQFARLASSPALLWKAHRKTSGGVSPILCSSCLHKPLSGGVGGGSSGVSFLLVRSSVSLSVCSPCWHKPLNPLPPSPMSPLTKPKSQRCSVHQTGKTNIWATTEESLNPRVKPARVCVWTTIANSEGFQALWARIVTIYEGSFMTTHDIIENWSFCREITFFSNKVSGVWLKVGIQSGMIDTGG